MQKVNYVSYTDTELFVRLEGKVDAATTPAVNAEFEELLRQYPCKKLHIDAEKLEYISSAGFRCLLNLQKGMREKIAVTNLPIVLYNMFALTGFTKILDISMQYRELSVDGCEMIGEGANGKVYRLSEDAIVKVYNESASLTDIRRERDLAEKSFVEGIPTCLTFDVVKVGKRYGVVFELLAAKVLSDVIRSNTEHFDEYAAKYVELYKTFHSIEASPADFPSIQEIYHSYIDGCAGWYTEEETEKLRRLVDSVPECNTLIHGDYHPRNIMYQNGELVVIDMGDVGRGHPMFDFLATASTQANLVDLSPEYAEFHTGMPVELIRRLWKYLIEHYFSNRSTEERAAIEEEIRIFSKLKVAMAPVVGRGASPEIIRASVEDAKANLIPKIDALIEHFTW